MPDTKNLPAARQGRILVIDDEAAFANLLADYLGSRGHQVTVVNGGLEGFREASRRSFDVITLDINMPGVNGVEAIRSMALTNQAARIVVVSGYLVDQVAADCRAAGAKAVLAKPVQLAYLGEVVNQLLAADDNARGGLAIDCPSQGS